MGEQWAVVVPSLESGLARNKTGKVKSCMTRRWPSPNVSDKYSRRQIIKHAPDTKLCFAPKAWKMWYNPFSSPLYVTSYGAVVSRSRTPERTFGGLCILLGDILEQVRCASSTRPDDQSSQGPNRLTNQNSCSFLFLSEIILLPRHEGSWMRGYPCPLAPRTSFYATLIARPLIFGNRDAQRVRTSHCQFAVQP